MSFFTQTEQINRDLHGCSHFNNDVYVCAYMCDIIFIPFIFLFLVLIRKLRSIPAKPVQNNSIIPSTVVAMKQLVSRTEINTRPHVKSEKGSCHLFMRGRSMKTCVTIIRRSPLVLCAIKNFISFCAYNS